VTRCKLKPAHSPLLPPPKVRITIHPEFRT
jgi:hypothetical protein